MQKKNSLIRDMLVWDGVHGGPNDSTERRWHVTSSRYQHTLEREHVSVDEVDVIFRHLFEWVVRGKKKRKTGVHVSREKIKKNKKLQKCNLASYPPPMNNHSETEIHKINRDHIVLVKFNELLRFHDVFV